jgi:hypothetical protein
MKLLVPFVIETPEQLSLRKRLFAEALLKNPSDPFGVALSVIPDTGEALRAANEWPADFEVIEHQKALLAEHGEAAFLPNKTETARLAYDMASGKKPAIKEQIEALELYGKIRGFIEKPGTTINNTTAVQVNRIMVIKDHGSNDDWERKAVAQQARLHKEVVTVDAD